MTELPEIRVSYPGPRAREIIESSAKRESHGLKAYRTDIPLVVAAANGSIILDVDDNRYLDLSGSYAAASLGHCHPSVTEAIRQQADVLTHCPSDYLNRARNEFLIELDDILPPGSDKSFPAISGTDAIEVALKLAEFYTGRRRFLAFEGGYHGRSHAALSITSLIRPRYGLVTDGLPVTVLPFAYPYRCPFKCGSMCSGECLEEVERRVTTPASGLDDVAAVIVEPIQGAGGVIVPPLGFLEGLEHLCREHDILLIADEIQTGFGRTGRVWAIEHWGLQPDLVVIGKGIGGGLPVAAVCGREELLDSWPAGSHTSTFITNALLQAAAAAAVRVFKAEKLWNRAEQLGAYVLAALQKRIGNHPRVGEIRGKGLLIGVEIVADHKSRRPSATLAQTIVQQCREHGVLIVSSGHFGNVLRISPPLTIAQEQLKFGLDRVCQEISAISQRIE